jgi:hypothetical protein
MADGTRATSSYLDREPRSIEDARIAAAAALLPCVRALCEQAKRQADSIDNTERKFGSPAIMKLARLLDGLWMACDDFASDLPDLRAQMDRGDGR